ncbi:hypothetical protein [Streptomyces sp. NPDC002962]|uniref:hypothetical protein n=1 Tax=Streptomyces sp. NPDC002962 TaxID=3364674 RepID=UPI0036A338FB
MIAGIRFRVRTVAPSRDMPVDYGPWGRICAPLHRWQRSGPWHRVLTRLQCPADAKGAVTWDLSVTPRAAVPPRRRTHRGTGPDGTPRERCPPRPRAQHSDERTPAPRTRLTGAQPLAASSGAC